VYPIQSLSFCRTMRPGWHGCALLGRRWRSRMRRLAAGSRSAPGKRRLQFHGQKWNLLHWFLSSKHHNLPQVNELLRLRREEQKRRPGSAADDAKAKASTAAADERQKQTQSEGDQKVLGATACVARLTGGPQCMPAKRMAQRPLMQAGRACAALGVDQIGASCPILHAKCILMVSVTKERVTLGADRAVLRAQSDATFERPGSRFSEAMMRRGKCDECGLLSERRRPFRTHLAPTATTHQ
jgi:hypothetical protein